MKTAEETREGQGSIDPCFDPCSPDHTGTPADGAGAGAPANSESAYRLLYVAGRVRLFERTRAGGRDLPRQGRRRRRIDEETTSIIARYVDPSTGRLKTESLTKPGRTEDLSTGEKRKAWARRKNEDLARLAREVAEGRLSAPETVGEAIDAFLNRCGQELRPKTVSTYKAGIDLFREWLVGQGITLTSAIRASSLSRFRTWLVGRPRLKPVKGGRQGEWKSSEKRRSPFAVNRDLRSVSALLHDLRRNGLLPLHDDEIADAIRPVKTPKPLPVFLDSAGIRQVLAAALRHDRETWRKTRREHAGLGKPGATIRHAPAAPFVLACLLTGARFGELAGLRREEVNLDAGAIFLDAARVKTGAARKITFDVAPTLATMFGNMRLKAGESEHVFRLDGPVTVDEGRAMTLRLRQFGAPAAFSWQTLRRTCGCFLACSPGIFGGASAYMAAKRLGHGVAVSERHYLGTIDGIPAEAKTLEAAMGIEDLAASVAGEAKPGQAIRRKRPA